MLFKRREQQAIRRYLLGQLSESKQRALELRLLRDAALSEQLEIVEDELVDAYLAGDLSSEERRKFEEIFLVHPERQRKLEAGRTLKRYFNTLPATVSPATGKRTFPLSGLMRGFSSPALRTALGVLAVAFIGFLVWRGFFYQSDLEKGLVALNDAYRLERPITARVSGIGYARFEVTRNGEPKRVDEAERARSQFLLETALKQDADASAQHAVGRLYLLQRDFNKAIDHLEQARAADPNTAAIYADLGAAYFERAKQDLGQSEGRDFAADTGAGVEDLGRGLEYLKRALELDPNLLPALFNRGLVHEQQMLYREAEADWRAYLDKDSTSEWAAEAQQHLKRLQEKNQSRRENSVPGLKSFLEAYAKGDDETAWDIYRRNHHPRGNKITSELLQSVLTNNSGSATENLRALNYLGRLELHKTQDTYTSDLARFYSSLTPTTRPLVIQAREEVAKGYALLGQLKTGEATKAFENALQTFKDIGNVPESLAVEATIAHSAVLEPKIAIAQEILERIIPRCESLHYEWLLAKTISVRAHLQSNSNNYSEAFSDSRRALEMFVEVDDQSAVLDSYVQLATFHVILNDQKMSCAYLSRALSFAERKGALTHQIWAIYTAIAFNFTALQLNRAALDYHTEALRLARSYLAPLYISRSYQYVGLTYGALGQLEVALQHVRLAYEQGLTVAHERTGKNMMANSSLKLGDLYRAAGDIPKALAAYEESSGLYDALQFGHYRYAAHKGKFLSYLAQNDDAKASEELRIVIDLFEEYRQKILEERQKIVFFDKEQDIYDLAIDFTYSRLPDNSRAYDYSELCRARNLGELMRRGAEVRQSSSGLELRASSAGGSERGSPLTAAEIQDKLPGDVQLVQFAVLEKKLLIWYVTRTELFPRPVEVTSAEITELVKTTLKKIAWRDQDGAAAGLKSLYRLLIEPIKDKLQSDKVLCFVPDKFLHYVPFAALLSNSSGRYMVQDYRVMVSPSATIFVESTIKARSKSPVKDERVLTVGNPAFDRATNPTFADLPDAETEVQRIVSTYASRAPLVGRRATRKSVLAELPQSDIAHFAAHFEVDPRSALSSKLLLSPEPGDHAHPQAAGLRADDIYRLRLTRTKLVVLSGCKTGIEQQFGGEGPVGFARAFLVAGVPVVVASLWPVESGATANLMVAFHQFRKDKKMPAAEALMHAQQEMLRSDDPVHRNPYYWAAFTVIGGHADF